MECSKLTNASEFLTVAETSLIRHETEHSLVLGLAFNVAQGIIPATNAMFFSVFEGQEPIGHAVTTHPDRGLVLSKMPEDAIAALVGHVRSCGIHLGGVVGPLEASERFARLWEIPAQVHSQLVMHQGVYQLDQIVQPAPVDGKLVPVSELSDDVVFQYVLGFLREALPEEEHPERSAEESLRRYRKNQDLFFWQTDDGPVSMAAKARETRNGATIALVYTPPEWRRRGYASHVVAALSDMQFKAGKKFCNLYTDLSNPTSNSIYQKIGYWKVGESKHFIFRRS